MEKIALLIDAENISASYIDRIYAELAKRGEVIVRRAYADWTKAVQKPTRRQAADSYNLWEVLNKWYLTLADKGIIAMHQPQNTYGKNSSDIYLIIDAMDLLYEDICDTFAIVSSDGDFTRLATRLLSGGKRVIIMGEAQTPRSVRNVAEFILLEDVKEAVQAQQNKTETAKTAVQPQQVKTDVVKTPSVQLQLVKNDTGRALVPQQSKPEIQKQAFQRPQQPQSQQQKTDVKKQDEKKAVEQIKTEQAKPFKKDASEYDNQIMNSIVDILDKYKNKDGEVTYQRLLVLLRTRHPDCDVIKVGESPIDLFKQLPQLKYRLDKATYYFSLKSTENATKAEIKKNDELTESLLNPNSEPVIKPVAEAVTEIAAEKEKIAEVKSEKDTLAKSIFEKIDLAVKAETEKNAIVQETKVESVAPVTVEEPVISVNTEKTDTMPVTEVKPAEDNQPKRKRTAPRKKVTKELEDK